MKLLGLLYHYFHPLLHRRVRLFDGDGERIGHLKVGEMGEKMACAQLRAEGRKILYTNFRGSRGGEIDIVARDGDVLSFVEVKTRRKRSTSRPLEAVNKAKQVYIKRGANAWLKMLKDTDFIWRFDVVEVELTEGEKPEITVVKAAFE